MQNCERKIIKEWTAKYVVGVSTSPCLLLSFHLKPQHLIILYPLAARVFLVFNGCVLSWRTTSCRLLNLQVLSCACYCYLIIRPIKGHGSGTSLFFRAVLILSIEYVETSCSIYSSKLFIGPHQKIIISIQIPQSRRSFFINRTKTLKKRAACDYTSQSQDKMKENSNKTQ